jgi:hypothetical protein
MSKNDCGRVGWTLRAVLCTVACGCLSVTVHANTQISAVTITDVSVYAGSTGSQGAYIVFTPAQPGVEGCTYATGNELWIDFTSTAQPDGKSLYAAVLAAYLAGRSLAFGVSGCAFSGNLIPIVYRVDVGA